MSGFTSQFMQGDGRPTHDIGNLMFGYGRPYARGCRLSDIDGVLDSGGCLLFVEMKHPGEEAPGGQEYLLASLSGVGAVMSITEHAPRCWSGVVYSKRWGFSFSLPDTTAIDEFGATWADNPYFYTNPDK